MWYRNLILLSVLGLTAAAQAFPAPPRPEVPRPGEQTSYLGVFLHDVNPDRARALHLPQDTGVELTTVAPNSPAANAGLMAGDVVLQYNGQRVEGIEQFSKMVRETPAGRDVTLQIFRNGASQTVTAKIGSHLAGAPPQLAIRPPAPPFPRATPFPPAGGGPTLGVETEALSGQLADYFGVKQGILVRSVAANSAAERAGIKAGDVITRVNDATVSNPADIVNQLRSQRASSVPVVIMRDHREMTITVMPDTANRF